jgi:hypothetical protein
MKSRSGVPAPDPVQRRCSPAALIGSGATMLLLALIARGVEDLVAVTWFGLEEPTSLGRKGVLWVSLFLVSASVYVLGWVACKIVPELMKKVTFGWVRRFLVFLLLLFSIMSMHFLVLVGASGKHPTIQIFVDVFYVFLISLLVAVLWPIALRLSPSDRAVQQVFGLSLLILGLLFLALEPDVVWVALADLGMVQTPRDLVQEDDFQTLLPYIAPVAPLLWSAFGGLRDSSVQKYFNDGP